jgi:hypothetical protein
VLELSQLFAYAEPCCAVQCCVSLQVAGRQPILQRVWRHRRHPALPGEGWHCRCLTLNSTVLIGVAVAGALAVSSTLSMKHFLQQYICLSSWSPFLASFVNSDGIFL